MVKQLYLTPEDGKKLIARALSSRQEILDAARNGTVVIIAGTTNIPLANLLIEKVTGINPHTGMEFHRGVFMGHTPQENKSDKSFSGDVILQHGAYLQGLTVYDILDSLGPDDILFKGANAVYVPDREAGILIGNPTGGTMTACTTAAYKGVHLIHPVGLEKRVDRPVHELAKAVNAAWSEKETPNSLLRLFFSCGTAYTELDAIQDLYGVQAELISSGGVAGFEGSILLQCEGPEESLKSLALLDSRLSDR